MKINLPVSQKEVMLGDDATIVSKTDLKGQITYINRDFVDISGFTESELLGESHNIVRHPDMPVEAFEDLWKTLKAGRPWIGMVKNRCKNGDHYWVEAHATPIVENGQTVGFMSVRKKPTRAQVDAADQAYRLFREKKQGNLKIEFGRAVADSVLANLNVFARMNIRGRLFLMIGVLSVLMILIGGMGLFGMNRSNEGLQSVYGNRTVGLAQINHINRNFVRNRLLIDEMLLNPMPEEIAKDSKEIEDNIAESAKLLEVFMATALTAEERAVADQFATDRKAFTFEGIKPTLEAIKAEKFAEATELAVKMRTLNKSVREGANKLIQFQIDEAKKEYEQAQSRFGLIRNFSIGLLLAGIALALTMGMALVRAIARPLQQAGEAFGQIGQGNYGSGIDITNDNEIGRLLQGLEMMQTKLGFDMVETKRVADEMTRIKIALDGAAMPITISSAEGRLIYMNGSCLALWRDMTASLRATHPAFPGADKMLGGNVMDYFDDEDMKQAYRAPLEAPKTFDVGLGGKMLRVTAAPVRDEKGVYLGRASQWLDRTVEIAVEREVADIVAAAAVGDLDKRIDMNGKEGFFAALGTGINRVLENTQKALTNTSEVLNRVAHGDLTQKIEEDYAGIFGQLKDDTNTTVERLREVVGRIAEATEAINTASQEIAAGNTDLSSRTEEQASSLEETAASMEELNATVKQNASNAAQANELAKTSNDIASRGGAMVKQVVSTMEEIQTSSKKIADIIGVIDSIAFQTNILALNAAVEAARAGEQGRGFAVVATEVRNLAQRSAQAAKEIKTLIAESVDKVEGGAKLVHQAGKTMDEVVTSFGQVANLVTEISNASREQSTGIEQVTQAVGQMDEVTQQNAALVEEAAAAAESLEDQARGLAQAVGSFKLSAENAPRQDAKRNVGKLAPPSRDNAAAARKLPPPAHAEDADEEWAEF